MHINASNHAGEEKNIGIHVKNAPGPDSALRLRPDASVLQATPGSLEGRRGADRLPV